MTTRDVLNMLTWTPEPITVAPSPVDDDDRPAWTDDDDGSGGAGDASE